MYPTRHSAMDASLRQGKADNNSHPLRENYAISRDDTSGNNREIEDLSAITPQTQRGDVVVVNLQRPIRGRRNSTSSSDLEIRRKLHLPLSPSRHGHPHVHQRPLLSRKAEPPYLEEVGTSRSPSMSPSMSPSRSNSFSDHGDYSLERPEKDKLYSPRVVVHERDNILRVSRPSRTPQPRPRLHTKSPPVGKANPFAKHATVTDAELDGLNDDDVIQDLGTAERSRSGPRSQDTTRRTSTSKVDNHLSVMLRPPVTDEVMEELEELRRENEYLKQERKIPYVSQQSAHPASTFKIFHYIGSTCYLDEPQWVPGDGAPRLRAYSPIRNVQYYLDQHPDIAFAIFKTYRSKAPPDHTKIETKDGVFRAPEPVTQNLSFISDTMIDAIEELIESVPDFDSFFPYFDPRRGISAPYLFMYYSAPYIPDILLKLDPISRHLLEQLEECIQTSHGFEHTSAKSQAEKGLVSKNLFNYLIRPGDVLVNSVGPLTQAYLALDWAKEVPQPEEGRPEDYNQWDEFTRVKGRKRGTNANDTRNLVHYQWTVPVWSWRFDGHFNKIHQDLVLDMKASYAAEILPITELSMFPLRYASPNLHETLERRGKAFWQLRYRKFVSYQQNEEDGELSNVSDRYIVDIETYKKLHPTSAINLMKLSSSIDHKEMESDSPPSGNELLLFPPIIPGYNLLRKMWSDLYVDQISDIVWNKQAFEDLVVDEETKELVQALVMKQLDVEKSTDVIQGKGNGLILLLHGGPGTGKTFTAEGVAEFAEKPLLRVTCGDVGTIAEVVEKRLRSNFHLGKIWDCVVLLDEADVFLEERDMKDLNRNALVSVFLRELEYHDGILILTSNRVGTFDEAFKSRIQLALHYENLGISQRRKIWRNLLNRVKTLDQPMMDFEDIMDHVDDLSQVEMNGREIRNAITTARQLAQFKDKALCYSHLKHVIRVSGKFSKYLKDLRDGLTEDDLKRDSGLRLTYKADKNFQKESPF